jgi:hypothetical protein
VDVNYFCLVFFMTVPSHRAWISNVIWRVWRPKNPQTTQCWVSEEFEDTKESTNRQHIGQKKKDKRTNNDLRTGGELRCSRMALRTGGELRCSRMTLITWGWTQMLQNDTKNRGWTQMPQNGKLLCLMI